MYPRRGYIGGHSKHVKKGVPPGVRPRGRPHPETCQNPWPPKITVFQKVHFSQKLGVAGSKGYPKIGSPQGTPLDGFTRPEGTFITFRSQYFIKSLKSLKSLKSDGRAIISTPDSPNLVTSCDSLKSLFFMFEPKCLKVHRILLVGVVSEPPKIAHFRGSQIPLKSPKIGAFGVLFGKHFWWCFLRVLSIKCLSKSSDFWSQSWSLFGTVWPIKISHPLMTKTVCFYKKWKTRKSRFFRVLSKMTVLLLATRLRKTVKTAQNVSFLAKMGNPDDKGNRPLSEKVISGPPIWKKIRVFWGTRLGNDSGQNLSFWLK